MANEVDYVPFATGGGANVYLPATYQALTVVATGVEPGLADPQLANTTWRLASMISAAVANFISNALNIAVLDDGNLANLVSNFTAAIAVGAQTSPSRTITSSANFNILTTDGAIAMARVTGLAPTIGTLPAGAAAGQKFKIADVIGNFGTANFVTIAAPVGHNIAGLASVALNVNRKTAEFQYHGNSTWSVEGVF
jgi:hypothetical protein